MNIGDDYRPLADRRSNTLHRVCANVPNSKDARHAGGVWTVLKTITAASQNKALVVQNHSSKQPARIGFGSDHHEHSAHWEICALSSPVIYPADAPQHRLTLERFDLRISVDTDSRRAF